MNAPSNATAPLPGRFRLDGRVALLTGAAGHLGAAMADALGGAGAHVILNGRSEERLKQLASTLAERGHAVSVLAFDVTDEEACRQAISRLGETHGRLDILVNNAYHGDSATMETATPQQFDAAYQLTVTAAFRLTQLARPLLEQAAGQNAGGASIVNVASMYATVSPDPAIYGDSGANNPPFYGPAKAGLIQLTRYAACHLAPGRIRVNSLSPGPFPLPSIAEENPEFHAALCRKNPMGRIGEASELAGPLLFLASDASSYVTGINLPVDGGWTAW